MWRLLRYLIGADVFISYARKDAGAYARQLADRLKNEPGVSVYLDQQLAPVGGKLPAALLRHLRLSRRLVAIITDASHGSFMPDEVEAFASRPRPVIPIDALESRDRPEWPGLAGAFWRTEKVEHIRAGMPSDAIVSEILEGIGADRQSRRTRRAAGAALAFVIIAVIGSLLMIAGAQRRVRTADEKVRDADKKVVLAQSNVSAAEGRMRDANEKAREAEGRERQANENAARQTAIAEATAMSSDASELLRNDPKQRDRALLMAMTSVRRLQDLGERSIAADAVLRAMLEESGEVVKQIPFRGKARALAIATRDGKLVATAHGGKVELWDTERGIERWVRALPGKPGRVHLLHFSDDGSHLAAAWNRFLTIWRTTDGSLVTSFERTDPIFAVAFSSDARLYAFTEGAGRTAIQETATDKVEAELKHDVSGGWISFSKDGSYLGTSGPQCHVWKWRAPGGTEKPVWTTDQACFSIGFSDDEIAVAYGTGPVIARSLAEGKDLWSATSLWTGNRPSTVDGFRIALAHEDSIEVRHLATGDVLKRFPVALPAHQLTMREGRVAAWFSNDTTAVYHLDDSPPAYRGHRSLGTDIAIGDGGRIVAVMSDGAVIWNDAALRKPRWVVSRALPETLGEIAFSADSSHLATIERPPGLFRPEVLRVFELRSFQPVQTSVEFAGACAVAFAGGTVIAGNAGGDVVAWHWKRGADVRPLRYAVSPDPKRRLGIRDIRISPSGSLIAASTNLELIVWKASEPDHPWVQFQPAQRVAIEDFAFGADDHEIVTLGEDERLRRWHLARGKATSGETMVSKGSRSMARLPGGLLAIGEGESIMIRDLRRPGAPTVATMVHGAQVMEVAADDDGVVLTAGEDGFLRTWTWTAGGEGKEIVRMQVAPRTLYPDATVISRDGRFVATARGRHLELRRLPPKEILDAACDRLKQIAGTTREYHAACGKEKGPLPAAVLQ